MAEARPSISAAQQEEADEQTAQEAAQFFSLLLKGLKNIGIYRHAQTRYGEYLEPAFNALTAFLARDRLMPLKLTPYTLELKKRVIYEEQSKESLSYRFYRDGMRFLVFREGLSLEELLRFVLLAMDAPSESQLFNEDMITRLWKENFQFIEYVVVEGFEFGDVDPGEVEIEVDKIVSYLRKQLAANNDDIVRFARLDLEDLELELSDIDQVRGGIISGRPAKDKDKLWVQEEILAEEKNRLFAKMVLILFQVLERDCQEADFEIVSESFVQILDSLLVSEDVRGAVAVLQRFERISKDEKLEKQHRDLVSRVHDTFAKRMAEPERLRTVSNYLALAKDLDELAVKAYFSVLSADQIPTLLEMLEGMERAEGRRVLIEVLAEIGKKKIAVFADRLSHRSSNVVRDMLAIIDLIDPPNKLDLYAKCLEHQNVTIRLEALKVIGNASGDRAMKYLEKAAQDEDLQMRLTAYRLLAVKSPVRVVPLLRTLMRSEDYTNRDKREQLAIAVSLGESRTQEALDFFSSVFDAKANLFSRGKLDERKQMAIRGLLAMKTLPAFQILAREVQNKNNSKEVIETAHKAALRLKAELSGQPAEQ
jgi:HEAT repeat protein